MLEFPLSSVTVISIGRLVTEPDIGVPSGISCVITRFAVDVQLSETVTFELKFGIIDSQTSSLAMVKLPRHVIEGFSLSVTVTVKLHVATLLLASVTVQTTFVVPLGNAAPANVFELLKLFEMVAPSQLSLNATGLNSFPTTV